MKISIAESSPGELDAMSHAELAGRLLKGFTEAADRLIKARSERDGEVHAVEELRAALAEGFKARLEKIRVEAEKTLGSGPE